MKNLAFRFVFTLFAVFALSIGAFAQGDDKKPPPKPKPPVIKPKPKPKPFNSDLILKQMIDSLYFRD